jgi:hypothetical protein
LQEKVDEGLFAYATPLQEKYLRAIIEHGSGGAAGRALGVNKSLINRALLAVKLKAAREGYAPGHWGDGVAPGYLMGKVTIQRANGAVERTWERQSPDQVAWAEAIKEGVRAFSEGIDVGPLPPRVDNRPADVIPWINIGDAHFGMLAHEAETGANFDLKIAERELCAAIAILIDEMGEHDRVVINDLGDFTHYENVSATTEASGHMLDHDGRFPKMIKVYSRVMRFIIEKVLEKANTVDVIVNQGNHSRTNDMWMAELLRVAYASSNRVNVLNNDSVFIGYRMGNTLVMTHHSDKCRPDRLIDVMCTDFREDFGETEFHYIYIGHIHHKMRTKEHAGADIESFNTMAAKDKWATDGGYRARQSITITHLSRTYGEIGRRVLPIREVRDGIEAALSARGETAVYRPAERRAFAV